jgi:hypothetical protein
MAKQAELKTDELSLKLLKLKNNKMQIGISTPALLFPAITLLLLAYTNRFLAIASLIRSLHKAHKEHPEESVLVSQISNLRLRMNLIRNMQVFGILSFVGCVLAIFFLYLGVNFLGDFAFGGSLILLLVSLGYSIYETKISLKALDYALSDIEGKL